MMTNNEWDRIVEKAFPKRQLKTPPFLWTRVLAGIKAEETRRAGTWWMQWSWMGRVTIAIGLMVSLGAFYLFQNAALPLDVALDGRSSQHQALQIASSDMPTADDAAVLVVGMDS